MKTTLTKDDPAGWYLCEFAAYPREERVRYWNGKQLCIDNSIPHRPILCKASMINFRRLHEEKVVTDLKDENRVLTAKCKAAEKWKATVLSKAELTLGGVYSMMTNGPGFFGSAAECFDAAVQKEMP